MAQSKEQKVTKETLKTLAQLADLDLSDERLEHLLPQMQAVVDSMAKLDELDLQDTAPAFTFTVPKG